MTTYETMTAQQLLAEAIRIDKAGEFDRDLTNTLHARRAAFSVGETDGCYGRVNPDYVTIASAYNLSVRHYRRSIHGQIA